LADAAIRASSLLTVVNANAYESKVLLDYAASKGWTEQLLFNDIIAKVEAVLPFELSVIYRRCDNSTLLMTTR
jgi:hypothetical protein